MKPKISLVTLGVRNFDRSFDFYRKGLGFELHNYTDGDDFAMFKLEGTWLSLFPRDRLAEDAGVPDQSSGFPGFSLAHNVKSPAEADAVFAAAVACGGRLQPLHGSHLSAAPDHKAVIGAKSSEAGCGRKVALRLPPPASGQERQSNSVAEGSWVSCATVASARQDSADFKSSAWTSSRVSARAQRSASSARRR
jgi:uncharacterized protein